MTVNFLRTAITSVYMYVCINIGIGMKIKHTEYHRVILTATTVL
jgi:hypothetical protein